MPWWANRPGRWSDRVENALASGDPDRIGVAWAVILQTGGQRGCQERAAEAWGLPKSTISGALSGHGSISRATQATIEQHVAMGFGALWSGCHPFAITFPIGNAEPMEPGDPRWDYWWGMAHVQFPTMPSPSDLRSRYPTLFP